METLEKYAPSFYGKDAVEKLNIWNTLLSANDFTSLISLPGLDLNDYIENLRKAEIFEQCANAIAELKHLKLFISWEEDYYLDYHIDASVSLYCENVGDYASKTTEISAGLIIEELNQNGPKSIQNWDISENHNDPGQIIIHNLALVCVGSEQKLAHLPLLVE